MRISDWSSDVCSSDLHRTRQAENIIYIRFPEGRKRRLPDLKHRSNALLFRPTGKKWCSKKIIKFLFSTLPVGKQLSRKYLWPGTRCSERNRNSMWMAMFQISIFLLTERNWRSFPGEIGRES